MDRNSKKFTTKVKCPKCKGSNDFELVEIWMDHAIYWSVEDGVITRDDGALEPGNPYKVQGHCRCGHNWTIRNARQIDDVITKPQPHEKDSDHTHH